MAGIKPLRKIQIGRESAAGTAVAATTIWRGMGTIEDGLVNVFPREDVGVIGGTERNYIPALGAALEMESVEATFEQFPHVLEAYVKTATPSQDGTGTGYIYDYDWPTTAVNTRKTYTIEGGDNQAVEEMEYAYVNSFTLEGSQREAWMMSAQWRGRQVATSSFTGALSIPSVEEMLFSKTKLYIDDGGGTIGSTQKSNTLLNARLTSSGLVREMPSGDGNLYFNATKQGEDETILSLRFEHDGTATAEKAAWRAKTTRLIRLTCEGTALGTAGATYTYKTMIIDVAGRWRKFEKIGEQDGNDIVQGELLVRYSSTDSLKASLLIVNELTALP